MKFLARTLAAGLSLPALLNSCASIPPQQLVAAREAYSTTSAGLAAKLAPTELYDASKMLDRANREFESNGDTPTVRDYAYVATRKIELADVKAHTEEDRQKIAAAVAQGVIVRDSQVRSSQAALADSRKQLKDERAANTVTNGELRAENAAQGRELDANAADMDASDQKAETARNDLDKSRAQLNDERASNKLATTDLRAANAAKDRELDIEKSGRREAESKLAGALKDLATREEARGLVITLSGSVLFASGKDEILQTARAQLDQVAEALKAQSSARKIVVEGHTDNQGSDSTNVPLSLSRAAAVRSYLISRGVDASKVTAVGLGSSRPLLNNSNAENRANNRRVEIVIPHT
jgi:outer membrane protein OmpA-like peptidoglycan-associated protein